MVVEQRGTERRTGGQTTRHGDDLSNRGKSFEIPKALVWASYKQVTANRGAAGCDKQTMRQFDESRDQNLYKIWNRLSSGSYFPPPVLRKEIPKSDGRVRVLGIPTISDRIAQGAVKLFLQPMLEDKFHNDSYGYRPNRSAHDALEVTRQRCWRYNWVVEIDIKGFFDNVSHELMLQALEHHKVPRWILLYVKRWLKAPMVDVKGRSENREIGTPQGGVISPLLANLFLHYGLDLWLSRTQPDNPFARYADDAVIHCNSQHSAERLVEQLSERLAKIGLELHPTKTRVVYVGRGAVPKGVAGEFTFLGYDFRRRTLVDRHGCLFFRVAPGASMNAMKHITRTIKSWRIHRSSEATVAEIARRYNATLRGWINYFGRYWYRAFSYRLWSVFQSRLVKWVKCKYRIGQRKAEAKLSRLRRSNPELFAHWQLLRAPEERSRAV